MTFSRVQEIKKAQKERLLFREISNLFLQASLDDSRLQKFSVSRVQLSPDKGLCTVFFFSPEGEDYFNELLPILKLYKPSMRKAIAEKIESRYTPELVFKFDEQVEKQERINRLIDQIKTEE